MASPVPARRLNNLHGRSRSPSPTVNSASRDVQPHSVQPRNNFLSPDDPDLIRNRRSTPTDPSIKDKVSEAIPLIDTDGTNPSSTKTELDDDNNDDRPTITDPYPGIDDGFFLSDRAGEDGPTIPENGAGTQNENGAGDKRPISPTQPDIFGTNMPRFPDIENGTIPDLESIPDVNVYQHKKTLAQGMMDLALFSANANQLRYVLESDRHPYYYSGVILISVSLILQVAIGVGLIWNSLYNVKDKKEICIANKINNFTVIGIFLVTVINVFICAFGVAVVQPAVAVAANP